MKHNYFVRSVLHVQKRFNEVFGSSTNNISERQTVILCICWLGVLRNKIIASKDRMERKDLIDEFNRKKNFINNFFNKKKGDEPCFISKGSVPGVGSKWGRKK